MAQITLMNAQLAYGHVALLDDASFALEDSERVGLIGRNGAGKSSLLRILAQMDRPDDGVIHFRTGLKCAFVAQEPSLPPEATVFEAVSRGLADVTVLRTQFESGELSEKQLHEVQSQIEARDGWNWEQRVEETLDRLRLGASDVIGALSGGVQKRVALAQALVSKPDVLLLDEPTNHLDLTSIQWLEDLLKEFKGSVVTVTHDRSFLDATATRIVELDRGALRSYPGNFAQYLIQKDMQLEQESVVAAKADKLLAQEEIWVRKGVEARRTRSQSRITRLQALRECRANRRDVLGRVQMEVASGAPSGKVVAELNQVTKTFGDRTIIKGFSSIILRGDKVGLIGSNGVGKSTLLKLILGEISPDAGKVRTGTNLQVAYFDQMRHAIDLDATLEDFISPGSEWIEIGRQRKHVKSYLADFLFSPARATSPVRTLSGGERNRLLLARLFARPANVLVLDEPTNDLDIETIELLEDLLQSYDGTVFLVSHDRAFLDNVVTSTIAHEGDGIWNEYEGGIEDWLTQSERSQAMQRHAKLTSKSKEAITQPKGLKPPSNGQSLLLKKKLSYKDQRELETLPDQISRLESEQKTIMNELADGRIYSEDPSRALALNERHAAIEDTLMLALERWEQLSS